MPRTIDATIQSVITELERSIVIHGDWHNYNRSEMVNAITDEMMEFLDAVIVNDEAGVHGMLAEARQLAVVCIKYLVCRS